MSSVSTSARPTSASTAASTGAKSTSPASTAASETRIPKGYEKGPDALSDVRAGNGLMRGHAGPAVADLQKQLNAAGMKPPLAEDGLLGPKTEAAIYKFQAANGLRSDGVVGPATLQSLQQGGRFASVETSRGGVHAPSIDDLRNRPAGTTRAGDLQNSNPISRREPDPTTGLTPGRAPGPFASTQAQREAQAEKLLKANGAWPPVEGKAYAIQIDQDSPGANASAKDKLGHLRSYSGQTCVYKCIDGKMKEVGGPFKSASHPGQRSTSGFTDVNADGKSDIAHLRSGVYEYKNRSYKGRYNPTNNHQMKVARDLNQDGAISASEDARAQQHDYYATGLQWHKGGSSRPSSVGCQTMPPGDFDAFQNAIGKGDGGQFTYLLVRRPNDVHGANPL